LRFAVVPFFQKKRLSVAERRRLAEQPRKVVFIHLGQKISNRFFFFLVSGCDVMRVVMRVRLIE